MSDNLSLVLLKKEELVIESRSMPKSPEKDEVLLKTLRVGICGSDLRCLKNGIINPKTELLVEGGMVIGHEPSAQVIQVGSNVKHLKEGDIVSIEPNLPCNTCNMCKKGRFNLCRDMTMLGFSRDGAASKFFTYYASGCHKMPESLSPEEGALIEPLSVGVSACRRAGIQFGDTVLITGAGPVGFMVLLCAKAFGATKIVVTDVNETRLQMAKEEGAHTTILTKTTDSPVKIAELAMEVINCEKFDTTFDCVGLESTVETAIHATSPGGKIIVIGVASPRVNIPLMKAVEAEIDIMGSFIYKNTWPFCIRMLEEKKIAVKQLATHVFKLNDALQAFEVAKRGEGIKVLIDFE